MPRRTNIQWCDYSSNPIKARHRETGAQGWACVRVSDGCKHCYSATFNRRLGTGEDFTVPAMERVEHFLDERELHRMLAFRPSPVKGETHFKNERNRPAVFVGDMTDIFGEWVPGDWLNRLFAAFALRPDVDWLLLTKRAERMREYLTRPYAPNIFLEDASGRVTLTPRAHVGVMEALLDAVTSAEVPASTVNAAAEWNGEDYPDYAPGFVPVWPLPNVWLGVSVENQQEADRRIPLLLDTPAAMRFISNEPGLGGVDLTHLPTPTGDYLNALHGCTWVPGSGGGDQTGPASKLDLVITGGESGREARPFDLAWAHWMRDQCAAAGVAWFCKQLGAKPVYDGGWVGGRFDYWDYWRMESREPGQVIPRDGGPGHDSHGGMMDEWPDDLRVREFPAMAATR